MSFTAIIVIGIVIFFGVALILVALDDAFGWDIISDDYDKKPEAGKSDSGVYQHENFFGVPGGKTSYKANKATHTDIWGNPHSYSERKGNGKIWHTDVFGRYTGYSVDKGDRIEHYDKSHIYKGYCKKRDGSLSHHDVFGTELGRSRKK